MEKFFSRRNRDTHKGDYGHVLVIAGSAGLTGAAYLTSEAALRSGCGLVTLGLPKSLNPIMEVKLTEVMTRPLPETSDVTLSAKAEKNIVDFAREVNVVALGPGLSRNPETQKLIRRLIARITKPLVIDADGINALAGHLEILKKRKSLTILTPHPGEMARLLRVRAERIEKERKTIARDFSRRWEVVLVLKGHRTVVANKKGEVYINRSGNPGMATAGVGDILTGIVASLLAQGWDTFKAVKTAVYVHGLAGDAGARKKGEISLVAGDLLAELPGVLKKLGRR